MIRGGRNTLYPLSVFPITGVKFTADNVAMLLKAQAKP
ncbi:hypothetical protein SJ05684_a38090 (plasmid) [Sinorhizobium sojae CCBAU 05684]|uniref:Uncharacterized protein n=1 Tax=Sinorhizobium sojae CCBAU 05684 TaxID=716928 RepID=A0A249PMF7_9HYPH|nr:hypothetical protein SS05631_a48700 [Sinorhizobium sp. CCBAU 05631]ASY67123.1 hypothetical protein SJ05684_a38090 [Sinorhizobium sojae CCBAU 05684]ASY73620.1 hypothetical protein SF83666_a40320 [Sinorhizobium fredii CCBAU 83666]AWI61821.1 hypothetical protein AB395_00004296 [Sinorhizobium fredii CCBAU 45436]